VIKGLLTIVWSQIGLPLDGIHWYSLAFSDSHSLIGTFVFIGFHWFSMVFIGIHSSLDGLRTKEK
jgi:hypothetical protein